MTDTQQLVLVEASCKICGKALSLRIDAEYWAQGDTQRLVACATCNDCYDHRRNVVRIVTRIHEICSQLAQRVIASDRMDEAREYLTKKLQSYMRVLAEHRGVMVPDWDEGILDSVMAKPAEYGKVLDRIGKMLQQPQLL